MQPVLRMEMAYERREGRRERGMAWGMGVLNEGGGKESLFSEPEE